MHTMSILSAKLGVEPHDIEDVSRIAKRDTADGAENDTRAPRPVVATLARGGAGRGARGGARDRRMRAARLPLGITTDQIEVPGNPKQVYINEHLTEENRILFSKARTTRKELKFEYV